MVCNAHLSATLTWKLFVWIPVVAGLGLALKPELPIAAPDRGAAASCVVFDGVPTPDYYRMDLVPTRRVPGTSRAVGYADVTFDESPFSVAVTAAGYYVYDLEVVVDGLPMLPGKEYVLWITTPDLQQVDRIGPLVDGRAATTIVMNKYLVVLTLEPADQIASIWSGPVVMRGMSRSGLMHTMAGHGPYEGEPCAVFGYQ